MSMLYADVNVVILGMSIRLGWRCRGWSTLGSNGLIF